MKKYICIAGKNNIAVDVAKYICAEYQEYTLLAITNKNDNGHHTWQKSFTAFCHQKNIPIVTLEDVYGMENLIFLSLEFDRIIIPSRFASKKLFNIHFSLLPEYKGMYTSALPILHNKKSSGVTLHKIDRGIDTGDIIAQKEFSIDESETARTLYAKYIKHGTQLVIEQLASVLSNSYSARQQPTENSTYFSKKTIDYSNLEIDLNATADQINAQIRAFTFREYQLPRVHDYDIRAARVTKQKSTNAPGSILENNDFLIRISTIDYNLDLYKDCLSLIMQSCKDGSLETLKSIPILQECINDTELEHGWSPLIVAAYNYQPEVCLYLLDKGADVNATNYNGTSVLMYAKDAALQHSDFTYMDIFIEHGADKHIKDYAGLSLGDYLNLQSTELKQYLNL